MNPERLRQIEALYHSACDRLPAQRENFLKDACAGDAELLRGVLALLAQDSDAGPMNRPVIEVAANLLGDTHWTPGTQIGPYQILSRLGEGGMGEVFKARDTRLGREVAIKTAHEEFSGRFQREARSISALNHSNICTLYDIGPNYLVMELVEGVTLAGPVPVKTAIGYARQIAAGLEAAHEKGIIHRDLKPANIKVTPEGVVKILDFGLAKSAEQPSAESPTMTKSGMILGTAAYMSPEQARGEAVDRRADIWAFGVVLYELLTGKRLFGDGKSVSEVIAAVLTREPDFNALPRSTPPRVCRLLERCLRKDPKQRLRDIGDARIVLDESEPESRAPLVPARRWPWAAGFAVLALLAALGLYRWLAGRPTGPFQHTQITRITDSGKATAAAISPDGKYVVHAVTVEGRSSLWMLHPATGSNVQILPPASGDFNLLRFSQDGNSLYYVFDAGNGPPALYMMPVLGGNARTLAAVPGMYGVSMSPDEKRLTFTRSSGDDSGLFIANLDGSGEQLLAARKLPNHLSRPAWSPDGRTVAYGVTSRNSALGTGLAATPVAGGRGTGINSRLGHWIGTLLWLPEGHGLVATANPQFPFYQIWYVTYPGGQARKITDDLNSYFGLSLTADAGALVSVQFETTSHIWVSASGNAGNAREISTGRLDGLNQVAWAANGNLYFEAPDSNGDTQIWTTTVDGAGRRQITTGGLNGVPAPCGDNQHMVFVSHRTGIAQIWRSDLNGGNLRQLTNGEPTNATSCSPDGSWLTYTSTARASLGVWRMPIDGGAAIRIWDRADASEISPDGKWVLVRAYGDNVRIIPASGGPPIKTLDKIYLPGWAGVVHWSADSTAFLYVKTTGGVSNVWRQPLDGSQPKQLTSFTSQRITSFAVSRDGKRLAMARGTIRSDVVLIRDLK